jgi:hypothetical protein
VNPGDLLIADDTGARFIPRADILRVLELCEKKKQSPPAGGREDDVAGVSSSDRLSRDRVKRADLLHG